MHPNRKLIRLQDFDYSENGAYFVTICTNKKEKLFGEVGSNSVAEHTIATAFEESISTYPQVNCPKYVVMPNHFHALIVIERADTRSAPTLIEVIQSFKSRSTLEYARLVKAGVLPPFDRHIWQRSFYDHVVRNDQDYLDIWKYIDENPIKWKLDRFYIPD